MVPPKKEMTSSDLATYQLQLQQVEVALTADPENGELLKLKEDLSQVIQLTKDLISQQVVQGGGEKEVGRCAGRSFSCSGLIFFFVGMLGSTGEAQESRTLGLDLNLRPRPLLLLLFVPPPVRLSDPREALAGWRAVSGPVEQGRALLRGQDQRDHHRWGGLRHVQVS